MRERKWNEILLKQEYLFLAILSMSHIINKILILFKNDVYMCMCARANFFSRHYGWRDFTNWIIAV
jgi:hypothetical protein